MQFKQVLQETVWVLLTEGRVSTRRLKQELGLNDEALDALLHELVEIKGWAISETADVLAWAGAVVPGPAVLGSSEDHGRIGESTDNPRLPGGERRQLTVMFCDLVGSTHLSTQLDPEDMQNVITAYHEAVTPVIEQYSGFIAKYMGDGILIYFGYPQAHEKDVERAVLAGLAVIEAMPALNASTAADLDTDLAVRIGIATGMVVVGDIVGQGASEERNVVGETPNLAARLQDLATENGIVVSAVSKALTAGAFEFEDLGLQDLKGIDEPTVAWRVVGELSGEFESETRPGPDAAPLVGRQEELGLLLRAWQQSKDGSGQVVAISGEAGIGKSRLIEAISAEVRGAGFTRITLRCSPHHGNSALYPLITHLRRVIGWNAGDDAAAKLEKLEAALADCQFRTEETVPLFAALFSLQLPEGRYPPLNMPPAQQRLNTLDAILAWQFEEAERQPILQVWEDIHWADPTTLELLEMTIDQCPTVSELNVLTFRPEFVPTWSAKSHIVPLTLNRLERPEVEALISQHAGGKTMPPDVVERIVDRGDGVPLYVGELTRAILASGSLDETDVSFELSGPLSDLSIPATLQDSLMARLDKAPTVREVAQLGAVFGREFPYDMLQAVAAIEEPNLRDGLDQLVDAELLYQRGRPPRAKYMFKHALIQDAAYQSLLKRTRQHYHQEVANLLSSLSPATVEVDPEILAHHFTEAGDNETASVYWQRSGEFALQRSATHEAIGHLSKGLAQLSKGTNNASQELAMQRMLGTAYMATKGYGAAETAAAFDRARKLCAEVTDDDSIYPVLFGVWVASLTRANHAAAFEVAVEMQERTLQNSDDFIRAATQLMMGCSHLHMGRLLDARDYFDRSHATFNSLTNKEANLAGALLYGLDIHAAGYAYGAWCEWLLGYPDKALERSRNSLSSIDASGHTYSHSRAFYWNAVIHQLCGDWPMVHDLAESAVNTALEHGLSLVVAVGRIMSGAAAAALKGIDGQASEVATALDAYSATGARFQSMYHRTLLADLLRREDDIPQALAVLNEAMHIAQETGEVFFDAEIHRLKGELMLAGDEGEAPAETSLMEALRTARAQDAKSLELRASMSLARLWRDQGKRTEARDLLAPVYGWFTEGFGTADLISAKKLLDELS
jgi:class 3 adenylate cyclase/predicted ATPase